MSDICSGCKNPVNLIGDEVLCRNCIQINKYNSELSETHMMNIGVPPRAILQVKKHFKDKSKLLVDGTSIFFTGPAGSGKTVKAAATLFYTYHKSILSPKIKPKTCKFITCPELLFEIKSTFGKPVIDEGNGNYHTAEEEIIAYYKNIDVLVLDDIGVEKVTDWSLTVLYLIISHRYEHFKQTMFTSNFSLDELAQQFGDARLVSRINGWCEIVEFNGKDRRSKN